MFEAGDIVRFYSAISSKTKYHFCLSVGDVGGVHEFLFINSEAGYEGDCVFTDGDIPGLPPSRTGYSVVSFSQIIRVAEHTMKLWRPKVISKASENVIEELLAHAERVRTLSDPDKNKVIDVLISLT